MRVGLSYDADVDGFSGRSYGRKMSDCPRLPGVGDSGESGLGSNLLG